MCNPFGGSFFVGRALFLIPNHTVSCYTSKDNIHDVCLYSNGTTYGQLPEQSTDRPLFGVPAAVGTQTAAWGLRPFIEALRC